MKVGIWERGYRCHGYWIGTQRIGFIGLPSRLAIKTGSAMVYYWGLDCDNEKSICRIPCKKLASAKKHVELAWEQLFGKAE